MHLLGQVVHLVLPRPAGCWVSLFHRRPRQLRQRSWLCLTRRAESRQSQLKLLDSASAFSRHRLQPFDSPVCRVDRCHCANRSFPLGHLPLAVHVVLLARGRVRLLLPAVRQRDRRNRSRGWARSAAARPTDERSAMLVLFAAERVAKSTQVTKSLSEWGARAFPLGHLLLVAHIVLIARGRVRLLLPAVRQRA